METDLKAKLEAFMELVRKISAYNEAISLMHWDLRTGAPRKSVELRSGVIGTLSAEQFKLRVSDEMGEYIAFFTRPEVDSQLDETTRRVVKECKKDYDENRRIPAKKSKNSPCCPRIRKRFGKKPKPTTTLLRSSRTWPKSSIC